jgi:hypothetical protein
MPEDVPMVATERLLLAHVPPVVALLKVTVFPGQRKGLPVIPPGIELTVMVLVA